MMGDQITFDNITEMFRRLTGREPTPEEVEEARRLWDSLDWSSDDDDADEEGLLEGYGSGLVLLVGGPHDGRRQSGFILRGRMECRGGVYLHVLNSEDMCLYWVPDPLVVEASEP
jgi:hypothetical protein